MWRRAGSYCRPPALPFPEAGDCCDGGGRGQITPRILQELGAKHLKVSLPQRLWLEHTESDFLAAGRESRPTAATDGVNGGEEQAPSSSLSRMDTELTAECSEDALDSKTTASAARAIARRSVCWRAATRALSGSASRR